jgi:hypothetical protein
MRRASSRVVGSELRCLRLLGHVHALNGFGADRA